MSIDKKWRMVASSLWNSPKTKNRIIQTLESKGYNAMVDEAGVSGGYNEHLSGLSPLIGFDSKKSLNTRKVSQISRQDEIKAHNQHAKDIEYLWKIPF